MWNQRKKMKRPSNLSIMVIVILVIGLLLTILNIYQLQQMKEEHALHVQTQPVVVEGTTGKQASKAPVVWVQAKRLETGYLKHVLAVFERLGFVLTTSGDIDWDVLWAHDYPFVTMSKILTQLKPHQRVNHFPGSGYITNKVSLATSQSKSIPLAFKIPQEKDKFLRYTKKFPEKMWVQKNNNHRGIRIRHPDGIDYSSEGSFVQEYVAKPLLIDKRKFDIGVYTVMTSINPLRVYIVDDDALFRFCPLEYYPFHIDAVDKYVVGDDYMPMWQLPSLKDIYTAQTNSFKETFNIYMRKQGRNESSLWNEIHDTIRTIYMEKEDLMVTAASKYKTTRNFFEMVRFDFVLDENWKVYLMEVNMSPNLSSKHFPPNRLLYEHVIYNMLRLVGVASMVENHFHNTETEVMEMQVSDKAIQVFGDWCASEQCQEECTDKKCALCSKCLKAGDKVYLKDAYLEHINRGGCRRMLPPAMTQVQAKAWTPDTDTFLQATYTEKYKLVYTWFIGMCRKDPTWCM